MTLVKMTSSPSDVWLCAFLHLCACFQSSSMQTGCVSATRTASPSRLQTRPLKTLQLWPSRLWILCRKNLSHRYNLKTFNTSEMQRSQSSPNPWVTSITPVSLRFPSTLCRCLNSRHSENCTCKETLRLLLPLRNQMFFLEAENVNKLEPKNVV